MKYLWKVFEMSNPDGNIHGRRFTVLTVFHLMLLLSTKKGRHFSVGLGIGPLEIATQFSCWFTDNLWKHDVGSA